MIPGKERTDWDSYYDKPFQSAKITRKYTTRILTGFIKQFAAKEAITICEIGGANSCFYDKINELFVPGKYIILDNNQRGLDKFKERITAIERVDLRNEDITTPASRESCDLVFSVGLIEHFDPAGTKQVIDNHFRYLSQSGTLILSFPTPTWLYRATRWCAERLSIWKFPDERPLPIEEVESALRGKGEIVARKILWPIFLTQCMLVVKVGATSP